MLVIDDDARLRRLVRVALSATGYKVAEADDGALGLQQAATHVFDAVLLDLGLPGIDGLEVLRRLRSFSEVPVLVVSAREDSAEKVRLLDAGADDYLTKPFDVEELLARLRAVLRRVEPIEPAPAVVRWEDVEIDLASRQVRRRGELVHLTEREFGLMAELLAHPGRTLTHRELLQRVWGPAYGDETHYLHVYVNRLRRKLEADPEQPRHIVAEWGVGFRYEPSS